MALYQTEKPCTSKKCINKTKMQPVEWKKIFENNISDKGLISKILLKIHITQRKKT